MIFKKTVQTIIYLPHFMSWVVVASVFKMLLAPYDTAPVNSILINMGAISNPIDFMNSTTYWRGTFYIRMFGKIQVGEQFSSWLHCRDQPRPL